MAMKFMKVYYDWLDGWQTLTMEERGRMMTILLQFARGEEPMEPEGNERYVLPIYRQYVMRDREIYQDICEKRRAAGKLGAAKRRGESGQVVRRENTSHLMQANAGKSDNVEANANKSDDVEANANKSDGAEASADKRWHQTIQMVASRMEPEYTNEAQIQAELEEKRRRTIKMLLEYDKGRG